MAFYVVVEGDGDRIAVPNLLARLGADLGYAKHWAQPLKINVRGETDAQRAAGLIRPRPDAEGLLVLRDAMPPGRAYKETTDQLSLTQMLDFERLRRAALPCFGTLERALHFLLSGSATAGEVFPLDR